MKTTCDSLEAAWLILRFLLASWCGGANTLLRFEQPTEQGVLAVYPVECGYGISVRLLFLLCLTVIVLPVQVFAECCVFLKNKVW